MNESDILTINEQIINGLRCNDPRAMKPLFDLFYVPLCSYARRYTGDAAMAEEIVSDVMTKIWEHRQSGYRAASFKDYLYTATRNTCLNYLKTKALHQQLLEKWADSLRDELISETPLDMLIADELQAKYDAAVANLPEQCRKAYEMSRFDELSHDEIADKLGISVNTVKYHIKTALAKLKVALGEWR